MPTDVVIPDICKHLGADPFLESEQNFIDPEGKPPVVAMLAKMGRLQC